MVEGNGGSVETSLRRVVRNNFSNTIKEPDAASPAHTINAFHAETGTKTSSRVLNLGQVSSLKQAKSRK